MDKREAKEIISNQLDAYRKRPYSELVEMIDTDPIAYKVNGPSGTSYQIEIAASWDDKPNGNIRVIGAIADHGLKAFAPMLFDEFIKSPKDEFKSILIKSWTGGVRSDDWKTPWSFAKLKLTSYELILNAILPTDFGFEKATVRSVGDTSIPQTSSRISALEIASPRRFDRKASSWISFSDSTMRPSLVVASRV